MMRILPDRSTILAKKELIYAGTFGVAAWLCGVVFIDRMSSDKARNTMKETAQNLVKNNVSEQKIIYFHCFKANIQLYTL